MLEFPNRIALIGVDIQEDFVNKQTGENFFFFTQEFAKRAKEASTVILTKSTHPSDHFSFSELGVHCVKGTKGAKINKKIIESASDAVVVTKISTSPDPPDSYSAFEAETLRPKESVEEILYHDGIFEVWIMGYGHSWDVPQTAFDAAALGYKVKVIEAYPAINAETREKLENLGIEVL